MKQERVPMVLMAQGTIFRAGLAQLLAGTRFEARIAALKPVDGESGFDVDPAVFLLRIEERDARLAEIVDSIRARFPLARVVLLASAANLDLMIEAIELGVSGYLTESLTPESLVQSLEVIMADGVVLPSASLVQLKRLQAGSVPGHGPPAQAVPVADGSPSVPGLSTRELGILHALATGDSNKLIARKLQIAEATVKVHVKAILRKIRVRNRTQAAIWAMNNGIPKTRDATLRPFGETPPAPGGIELNA